MRKILSKLSVLSRFLVGQGLQEAVEKVQLIKTSTPIPPGEELDVTPHRFINLDGPESMTSSEIEENLKLKDIFLRRKDDSFIDQFQFIHFFRGTPSEALDFMRNSSIASNSTEMSVVGFRGNICDAVKNPHFGSNNYIFLMEGTAVSAFYFDATSSLTKGFMDSEVYQNRLKDLGVNIEDNLPKVVNISDGQLHNFFYDKRSYEEASDGRRSDYHEFILRGARVKSLILDSKMRLDRFYENLSEEIKYDGELLAQIKICEGGRLYDSDVAIEKLTQSSKAFTYSDGWRNRSEYWNHEKFENIIESLSQADDGYRGELVDLEMAIDEAIDVSAMEIENIGDFISSIVDFAGHTFYPPQRSVGQSYEDWSEAWTIARERHIKTFLRNKLKTLVAKNMSDINSVDHHDPLGTLLFGGDYESYTSRTYGVRDMMFEEMAEKGLRDLSSIVNAQKSITNDNIEDISYQVDKLYSFLYETSPEDQAQGPKTQSFGFFKWNDMKEAFLEILQNILKIPGAKAEFIALTKAYQLAEERIPYSFIKEYGILYGLPVVSPIPEANELMRFSYEEGSL